MVRAGTLPVSGFLKQEEIPLEAFLATRTGALYRTDRQDEARGLLKELLATPQTEGQPALIRQFGSPPGQPCMCCGSHNA